jgi:hypothetical protein
MRTRQKLTAVGAVAVAGAAISGGALFTSHAMAAGSKPATGRLVIITKSEQDQQAYKCTFDDIDLPAPGQGEGTVVHGVAGGGEAGTIEVTEGTPSEGPGLHGGLAVPKGREDVRGAGGANGPTFDKAGSPPEGGALPPIVIDDIDARSGTPAECAAVREDLEQGR